MSKNSSKQRVDQLQGWITFVKSEAIRKGKQRK
jgi:hypothetical protein